MNTPTPEPTSSDNLPALTVQVGGALVSVMSQLADYTDGTVNRRAISMITRIVQENPDLNTESRVAMLADLASFHDEPMGVWLSELLKDNDIEVFYLAVDYLYHIGHRGPTRSITARASHDGNPLRELMSDLCDFIMELRDVLGEEPDVEMLDKFVRIVGLNNIRTTDPSELLAIRRNSSYAGAALFGIGDDPDDELTDDVAEDGSVDGDVGEQQLDYNA